MLAFTRRSTASTAFHKRSRSFIQTGAFSGAMISAWTTPRLDEKSNTAPLSADNSEPLLYAADPSTLVSASRPISASFSAAR